MLSDLDWSSLRGSGLSRSIDYIGLDAPLDCIVLFVIIPVSWYHILGTALVQWTMYFPSCSGASHLRWDALRSSVMLHVVWRKAFIISCVQNSCQSRSGWEWRDQVTVSRDDDLCTRRCYDVMSVLNNHPVGRSVCNGDDMWSLSQ